MNIEEAKDIAHGWSHNEKINAIKVLRQHTAMGLYAAKTYLDDYGRHEQDLVKQLCMDFVKDPKDLLIEARAELRRHLNYIESLVLQVGDEEVPQALLDAITDPPKVTLADVCVTDVIVNGRSIFPEPSHAIEANADDHVVVEIKYTERRYAPSGFTSQVRVVPAPEWEAEERINHLEDWHLIDPLVPYESFISIENLPTGDFRTQTGPLLPEHDPTLIRDFE